MLGNSGYFTPHGFGPKGGTMDPVTHKRCRRA